MIRVGSRWRRRVERHEPYDFVEVVGRFEQREIDEYVLRPVDGFGDAVSVPASVLAENFTLVEDAPDDGMADIAETGGAWVA